MGPVGSTGSLNRLAKIAGTFKRCPDFNVHFQCPFDLFF